MLAQRVRVSPTSSVSPSPTVGCCALWLTSRRGFSPESRDGSFFMKQTLLIADGDAELCDLYEMFLTECGYEVEAASDGLDCLRKLRQVIPAVLVLDLELRWGGGDGVLARLREESLMPG